MKKKRKKAQVRQEWKAKEKKEKKTNSYVSCTNGFLCGIVLFSAPPDIYKELKDDLCYIVSKIVFHRATYWSPHTLTPASIQIAGKYMAHARAICSVVLYVTNRRWNFGDVWATGCWKSSAENSLHFFTPMEFPKFD